jgi:hypothetical protein
MTNKPFNAFLTRLSSVRLTLVAILLAMVLIVVGTLAQVELGTFEAQKKYFDSWWVYGRVGGIKIPIFPGGLTVGSLWLLNLIASFITRFRPVRKDLGIFISHAGLILLLIGQFLTQSFARESQMPILVGESSNYSENTRAAELVFIKTSDPEFDEVTRIAEARLKRGGEIRLPKLPFHVKIQRFYPNAQLHMAKSDDLSGATQGIGRRITVQQLPRVSTDEEANNVTALVEVLDGNRSLGVWLVSLGLGAPQSFHIKGEDYRLAIRPERIYYPFTLTLKEFRHDVYPGTDIPKNFSSLVQLSHPDKKEFRQALIYMNNPLRYEGETFYQASFGEGDRLSVFQVVDNPAAAAPYVACAIVILGLMIQFLSHLVGFVRTRR